MATPQGDDDDETAKKNGLYLYPHCDSCEHGGLDVYSQDAKVAKLDLTEQQKKDLVSFMKSLNDTAPPPKTPASVPSGLPVVGK